MHFLKSIVEIMNLTKKKMVDVFTVEVAWEIIRLTVRYVLHYKLIGKELVFDGDSR